MILSEEFQGDDNSRLKAVQHDLYPESVAAIFDTARRAMVLADAVLMTNLELVRKAKAITHFDHRVLQAAHDILAARYRYLHDDAGQTDLFETTGLELRYTRNWSGWLDAELQKLARIPVFVRSAVEAVVFSNSEFGNVAEDQLCNTLVVHVGMGDWGRPDGYVRCFRDLARNPVVSRR